MSGVVNVSGGCAPSGWSAGPDMPTRVVRAVGVYFQADGNFYTVGGRTSDAAGADFQHVLQYNPSFQQLDSDGIDIARQPDEQHGLWRASCLRHSVDLLRGRLRCRQTTATARVFTYNPATDTYQPSGSDDWPGDAAGTILPGGFTVANNKLYILGGFNINVASTNQIWEFDPTAAAGPSGYRK